MSIENYLTVAEAAERLQRMICRICRQGGFVGTHKVGQKMWIIPEQSLKDYVAGPKGFAVVKARKEAEARAVLQMLSAAINNTYSAWRKRETQVVLYDVERFIMNY